MSSPKECAVCSTPETAAKPIQRCARCHDRYYCGKDCQVSDWKTHKRACAPKTTTQPAVWYDRFRKCRDGNRHEGKLELITWDCPEEETGWGNCFAGESEDMKKKFTEEFGGDEEKLHGYWPQAFRWTCCGTDADIDYGCDHHGSGSRACTCDYCRMGKPLPDKIYFKKEASRLGLSLRRGPDPRSFRG